MTDWMGRMGINPGGSNFAAVRNQTKRLSACRLTVGWMSEDGNNGFTRENIVSAMINPPINGDPSQGRLWAETAEWSGGDRKSDVEGKSVSVRVDLGGRCIIQKKE